MSKQLLFIDDDPNILSTMKRNLSLDFDVHTAEGAKPALELVQNAGSIPVVVVDMQMPEFNGIETISMLRKQMPSSVYIMLTGNQDQSTAIQAVNDGKVFRFLNKPCGVAEITDNVKEAMIEYSKNQSEKELLTGTFLGAINMMTDLIELPDDRQVDTTRLASTLTDLANKMSVEIGWEEKVAARVFLVGMAMLNTEEAKLFQVLDPTTDEHQEIFKKVCKTSASIVRKMPRLGWVVDLLKAVPDAEVFHVTDDRKDVAAVLLRVVFYWNFLTMKGHSPESATSIVQKVMSRLSEKLTAEMQNLHDNHDAHVLRKIEISELSEGMIPHVDISRESGEPIVRRGRHLTASIIENLRKLPEFEGTTIQVIENSIVRT